MSKNSLFVEHIGCPQNPMLKKVEFHAPTAPQGRTSHLMVLIIMKIMHSGEDFGYFQDNEMVEVPTQ